MKKIKFVGLPILALTAIAGLASCNGGGVPKQKPGVIFHASAMIRKKTKSETGETKVIDESIDFKDKECAEVTISNEEGLQYGKTDVEIFIKPQDFFTFRKYDPDDWKSQGSMPARPYVGLGNPISLYSYPLQENVAWTFTDLSVQLKDKEGNPTGFYDEQYKITVKKEYFQKNIVIDYGNVETLNNCVYVYNSGRYNELFGNNVSGDFSQYYRNDPSASSYAAASPGATVTYVFSDNGLNDTYTFEGWDSAPTQSANSNADKIPYDHFKVYGITKEGKRENIALYEPGVAKEKQAFIPTFMEKSQESRKKQYLSFFFRWDLLAYGKEEGYENKYNKIDVEFKTPTPKYIPNEVKKSEGITVYPGGLFQHPNSIKEMPIDSTGKTYQTYTKNSSVETPLTFYNVLDVEKGSIYYSILFELPNDEKKNSFAISVNGEKSFEVDLLYGTNNKTNWRTNEGSRLPEEGESELYFWQYKSWHLVQLNPADRTYGFSDTQFIGKSNLYYLYASDPSAICDRSLDINIEFTQSQITTFNLKNTTYGKFIGEGVSEDTVTRACGDKSYVNIPFMANQGYNPDLFIFTITTEDGRKDLKVTYSSYCLTIESVDGKIFGHETVCTIDIDLPATKIKLLDHSNDLGSLFDGTKEVEEITPTIDDNPIAFQFKLKEGYSATTLAKTGEIKVIYNSTDVIMNIKVEVVDDGENNKLEITVPSQGHSYAPKGGLFEISVKYIDLQFTPQGLLDYVSDVKVEMDWLYESVASEDPEKSHNLTFVFRCTSDYDLTECCGLYDYSVNTNYNGIHFEMIDNPNFNPVEGEDNIYRMVIDFSVYYDIAPEKIPNGINLDITLNFNFWCE